MKMPITSLPPLPQCSVPGLQPERASWKQEETKPTCERENYSKTTQVLIKQNSNKEFQQKRHVMAYIP